MQFRFKKNFLYPGPQGLRWVHKRIFKLNIGIYRNNLYESSLQEPQEYNTSICQICKLPHVVQGHVCSNHQTRGQGKATKWRVQSFLYKFLRVQIFLQEYFRVQSFYRIFLRIQFSEEIFQSSKFSIGIYFIENLIKNKMGTICQINLQVSPCSVKFSLFTPLPVRSYDEGCKQQNGNAQVSNLTHDSLVL